ncbi:MAG TPA: acetylornithine transaminase [Streptosporangiaceae bacterium]|jgi:acetylornithine aminotransferase
MSPLSANDELRARFDAALMPNYGTPPVAIARGEGSRVWDVDGNPYLDLIAGIAVSSLGHAHPALVDAVTSQVSAVAHTSNLFLHEPEVALAERLLALLGTADARVFFTNSGTEANEAAYKLVRRHAGPDAYVVAAENGFHGRSMGALALTGKAAIRDPFGPHGADVRFVPYGDADALADAVGPGCGGVFLEPTLGEGGIVPPPDGYLAAVRKICDATGAIFVLDEIQSGIGRTGAWFAHQHDEIGAGVRPDVLTLAKGLGGGLPIGACVGFGPYATTLGKGDHGSTFGGNPVSCAAALAVLDTIERDDLLAHVRTLGTVFTGALTAISHPLLAGIRGRGLWLALALAEPVAPAVEAAARARGYLVNAVKPDTIRIAPPLVLTEAEALAFTADLPSILDDATGTT